MGELEGKVAIVTGASAGIGLAAAQALAGQGAHVVLADVQDERGSREAEAIRELGGVAMYVHCDVSRDADVASLVDHCVQRFGRLDMAFNNAGIEGETGLTAQCSDDNWNRVLAVNLTGVWQCMRHEIPAMLDSGGGSIVNCSSIAGLVGFAGVPAYVASKHGIVGLTRTAALEYATQGIRVNAVCPGVIKTEMIDRFVGDDPQALAQLVQGEPIGRMGEPREIADAVVWLCSHRSSFVTGQAIAVDGGFVAR